MVSLSLVGSLLALAVLEHWFLVLPLPSENLWKWAVRR
jgi:putative photosynthetic complex assembly protein 2